MATTQIRTARLALRYSQRSCYFMPRPSIQHYARVRHQSTQHSPPSGDAPPIPRYGGDFSVPLRRVGWMFYSFGRAVFVIGFVVGTLGAAAYGAAHMYVESVCLEEDDITPEEAWGFDLERERWTGRRDPPRRRGGTDPRLGWSGRNLLRSAWMAINWGVGPATLYTHEALGEIDMFGFEVPAREWAFARAYIGSAMGIAKQKTKQLGEWPASDAAQDLLVQYGSILQRIGGRRFLLDARDKYEELVKELHKEGRGPEAARWGAKMGDLTKRLGESGDAWWIWAVRTAAGDKVPLPAAVLPAVGPVDEIPDPKPTRWWFSRPSRPASVFTSKPDFLPTEMPKSPLAERVMANALVALSAQWAEDGRLRQALELEKASLRLLGGVLPPSYTSNPPTLPKAVTAASSTQPSQTATDPAAKRLHLLSLSHARALLQIHQAEVLFSLSLSLKHPFHSSSLDLLQAAARQAEYAISQLTAIPLTHPDFPESPLPAIPTPDAELDGVWSNSSVLKEPSRRLLRDARRTAAHAWALSAVLYERQGEWLKAYECAERGMEWVAAGRVLTDFSRSPEAATKGREGLVAEFAETFEVHQRTRMKMLQYTHGTVVDPTKDNVADKSGEAKGKAKAKEGK